MPMHISPRIDTDSGPTITVCAPHLVLLVFLYRPRRQTFSRMSPITNSLPPTENDILGILQREQDHAVALLSSSPLLSSLFVSYANRAATLESASATPSPESEEWKALRDTVTALQEENEKLKSENLEVVRKLEVAVASREAFCSQVSSLKEVNTTQQDDIGLLQVELAQAKDEYNRLMVGSNTEGATLRIQVSDLEVSIRIWSSIECALTCAVRVGKMRRVEGDRC